MKILVSAVRWIVMLALLLGAAALLLEKPIPGVEKALRGDDSVYPFYISVLWCVPYIVALWGVLTWKRWSLPLLAAIALFELASTFVVAIVYNTLFARNGDILGNTLVMSLCFIPMWYPEFLRRNQLA
jgi:hypothetical protein